MADKGPGLTPEQAGRVFERFYRADPSRRRPSGGSGLGLAIVESLVRAHGGEVGVETAPGAGAAFRVTLPSPPRPAPDPAGIGQELYDLEKRPLRTKVNWYNDYLGPASSPRIARGCVRISHYERA
ncbi:hypothetical protein GCM10027612_85020 [Microbispora bryophytorum subsp. camponoti]